MSAIKLVIGDRLGKGQKVGAGAEAAGATVTVIPGMAADMKLGDVMNKEQADLGISFCGSGGAGADGQIRLSRSQQGSGQSKGHSGLDEQRLFHDVS